MDTRLERTRVSVGPSQWMYRAADGGPIRFGVTGRKLNTTHIYNSTKVKNHILPAESDAELLVMSLLDLSTSALTYMSQPHTLIFPKKGGAGRWQYTPDLEVVVPRWFVRQLENGVPFVIAALKMPQLRAAAEDLVALIIEVKGASKHATLKPYEGRDPLELARAAKRAAEKAAEEADYKAKLKCAKEIYLKNGYYFHVVEEVADLRPFNLLHLPSILMDDTAKVSRAMTERAWRFLGNCDGITTYGQMIDALGGGPDGREFANALHIRGHIWIDFFEKPHQFTKVAMPPILGRRHQALATMTLQ